MTRVDDVIDEIDAAAKRMMLYQIPETTPAFTKQTDVLLKACRLMGEAVSKLRDLKKPNGLNDKLVEIHFLENVGDDINHAALAELFERGGDPLLVFLINRDVLRPATRDDRTGDRDRQNGTDCEPACVPPRGHLAVQPRLSQGRLIFSAERIARVEGERLSV